MDEKYSLGKKIVKTSTNLVLAYAILGAIYMLPANITGHVSSDVFLEKSKLTRFEKAIYTPVFDKLGIESTLLNE